jgi:Protein of unknown function (DUF2442)
MSGVVAKNQFDEPITDAVLRRAIERGQQRHRPSLHASEVRYVADSQTLTIGFSDQTAVVLPIKNYPELAKLSRADLGRLALGFAGSALCLEDQDLHVSIAGLVSASTPLMEMAATVVASRNGSRSSTAKSIASRENGQKGGRPRKVLTTAP